MKLAELCIFTRFNSLKLAKIQRNVSFTKLKQDLNHTTTEINTQNKVPVTHLRMTPSNRHDIFGANVKLAYKKRKSKKAHLR